MLDVIFLRQNEGFVDLENLTLLISGEISVPEHSYFQGSEKLIAHKLRYSLASPTA
jgi:hypothetical protein